MQMSDTNDTLPLTGPDLLDLLDLRWEPEKETAGNFYTGLRDRYSGTYGSLFKNCIVYIMYNLDQMDII